MSQGETEKRVFWYEGYDIEYAPSVSSDISADAVVVGGGMAGLFAAYRLRQANKDVVLLERDFCGSGASGKTSGFITPNSEVELSAVQKMHGPDEAKRVWNFVSSGVERIREQIEKNKIACDYQVQDSLYVANNRSGMNSVLEEFEAREELDYPSTLYRGEEIRKIVGSEGYVGGVRFPNTFGINSFLFCQEFKKVLMRSGVRVHERANVSQVGREGVKVGNLNIRAPHVIVATDRFIPDFHVFQKEIYHVQTFLGISTPLYVEDTNRIFPSDPVMAWDTDLVYNYFRLTGSGRLLIGGGDLLYTYAQREAGNSARFARRLSNYIKSKFPSLKFEIDSIWPGMLGVSKDLLPIVGNMETAPNVWYVGAATGLPWAAELGNYLADKILTGRSDFDERFSPRRKFPLGPRVQKILGTPLTFAASHGITEYF